MDLAYFEEDGDLMGVAIDKPRQSDRYDGAAQAMIEPRSSGPAWAYVPRGTFNPDGKFARELPLRIVPRGTLLRRDIGNADQGVRHDAAA